MINDKFIKICEQKFIKLNYSSDTKDAYMIFIKKFITIIGDKQIVHCNSKDFQRFIDDYEFSSTSQQNIAISSIQFLYNIILNKKYKKIYFKRPRKEKSLPRVIDKDEILEKLEKIKNIKHRAILSLAFSTGIRVSEVCNLKIKDIDSKRMLIYIIKGKGNKDRIVPLSEKILFLLRDYYKIYKPKEHLFNGQKSLRYSKESCRAIYKKYIENDSSFHCLRHSCFTALMENDTNERIIQKIAGHNSIKTTEIYTHVSKNTLNNVKLPL